MVRIAREVYGIDPAHTKEVLAKVLQATKQETLRRQAQEVIDLIERFDDYIIVWQVSGPYTKDVEANELLGTPFAPEQEGQEAQWKAMPTGTTPDRPWLIELDKVADLAGNTRCAYLRTRVWSPKEQKARLQLGSDDGVKVWINGQLVHENNAERAVQPGQDKKDVTLKKGHNPVLVKLTQNGGEWALCMRFRAPDGGKLEGVKVEP